MEKAIVHKFFFSQSPEIVWDYLVKPELLAQWLMESDFQPIVGHHFQFKTRPKIKLGFDGRIFCQVLEIVPLQRISYTWRGGLGEKTTLDSIVTWTLTSKDGGTELLLEHRGFRGIRNYLPYIIMNMGWIKIGKRLRTILGMNLVK